MSEGILFSDFQKSASVWSEWATGLRQACLQRLKSVQDIDGKDCSSWPTAAARDHKGSSKIGARDRTSGALDEAAEQMWATPNVPNRGPELSKAHRKTSGGIDLQSQVLSLQAQPETGEPSLTDGRNSHQQRAKRLNPLFVAWLMGYLEPINCGPMETQSCRIVQRWLLSVCGQH
jgi:hypothetical protein